MARSTAKAGLLNTWAISRPVRLESRAQARSKPPDRGRGSTFIGGGRSVSAFAGRSFAGLASKLKVSHDSASSAPATGIQMARFHSSGPTRSGITVLASAAVK